MSGYSRASNTIITKAKSPVFMDVHINLGVSIFHLLSGYSVNFIPFKLWRRSVMHERDVWSHLVSLPRGRIGKIEL